MFPVNDEHSDELKYAGISKAVVIDNKDPAKEGRIKVNHPLLGVTSWVPYLQAPFTFDAPNLGDIVYIQFDGGIVDYPVAWGKLIAESSETQLPEVFKRDKPTNRGFYSPGGHLVEFDDGDPITELGKGVRITSTAGAKVHLTEDSGTDDKILIEKPDGQKIEIDSTLDVVTITNKVGEAVELNSKTGVTIKNETGDKVTLFSGTLTVQDVAGDKVELNDGKIEATNVAGAKLTLDGADASIFDATGAGMKASGGQVALGGATAEVLDILNTFLQELATDTFAGFGAPAGKAAIYAQLAVKLALIKGSL